MLAIAFFFRTRAALILLGSRYQLAARLRDEGVVALQLSREHYSERLPTFLARAKHSIHIVSISLKVTDDESELLNLFRRRISENPDVRVVISLLDPANRSAMEVASASLNITANELTGEVQVMLTRLMEFRDSLDLNDRSRMRVLVHQCMPMGSAILLDAAPDRGTIQVETKLYGAARIESFGYKVVAPSPFYTRNYRAWGRVLDDSHESKRSNVV